MTPRRLSIPAAISGLLGIMTLTGMSWTVEAADAVARPTSEDTAGAERRIAWLALDPDSYWVRRSAREAELPPGYVVRVFLAKDLTPDGTAAAYLSSCSLVLVDVMGRALAQFLSENNLVAGRRVYALRGSNDDESLRRSGFVFSPELQEYFSHFNLDNGRNLLRRAAAGVFRDDRIAWEPVRVMPETGLYHPDAPEVFADADAFAEWRRSRIDHVPGRPRLGFMFYTSFLSAGQREAVDDLIRRMEDGGFEVWGAFGMDAEIVNRYFLDENRRARVDAVLAFSLKFYSSLTPELAEGLAALDVPLFNAVTVYSQTIPEWRASAEGLPTLDVTWCLANPEISGLIEPTPLMGKVEDQLDGEKVFRYEAMGEHLDRLLPRLRRWIRLRDKPNADKRVAILYYNYNQGKQNIGATYMNVFRSIEEITAKMADAGYTVSVAEQRTKKEIERRVLATGRNIGSWAPGELEKMLADGNTLEPVTIPVARYREWFDTLPEEFRAKTLEQWGRPEDSGFMTHGGQIVIPVVRMGPNLVLLPEPARGLTDEPLKLVHDPTLYPPHQYIAAYAWLQREFDADALIHLGTHATYEWLPGKQAGLSVACPPEVVIGDIPNIYPYIVDDIGEGLQAKRRGRGVIVDHLTPALTVAEGYGEYAELKQQVDQYRQAMGRSSPTAESYREKADQLARALGVDRDLSLDGVPDLKAADALAVHLEYMEIGAIPHGLHTFGRSPTGAALDDTIAVIMGANDDLSMTTVKESLTASGAGESDGLLRGLSGRFVRPGEGNDPVRNPSALPTGNNFYGFSPDRLPTPAAWALGQQAADDILKRHRQQHDGRYPEKVAVVVWATETLRNEGVNEATVLALVGVEPVWNPRGQVTGTRPISAARLGRPRVDVVVDISGLYRDLFPDKVKFLDAAIRQAAAQSDVENFIARHDARIRAALLAAGLAADEAERLSRARVFSEAPGNYGNRVSELVSASGLWEDDQAISDTFLRHTGYAYGVDFWGTPAEASLRENLANASVAWHSRSSEVFGLMDNDDMFMYLGGLNLAIREISGSSPEVLIADQRRGGVSIEPLRKMLGQEARMRYLNPKWIKGMMAENYAGAREMSDYVEYLWGWQATTPDAVDATFWEQTYAVYVENKHGLDIKEFMGEHNPWAFQSLTGRMLEAVRKDYWDAPETVRRRLVLEYAMNVVAKGVACCDHTCNNPRLDQMVMTALSLPGLASPELAEQFKLAVETTAGKSLEDQVAERRELLDRLAAETSQSAPPAEAAGADATENVKGLKMEPLETPSEDDAELGSSGVKWFTGLLVLSVLILFFLGFRRRSVE